LKSSISGLKRKHEDEISQAKGVAKTCQSLRQSNQEMEVHFPGRIAELKRAKSEEMKSLATIHTKALQKLNDSHAAAILELRKSAKALTEELSDTKDSVISLKELDSTGGRNKELETHAKDIDLLKEKPKKLHRALCEAKEATWGGAIPVLGEAQHQLP
jgi:hypothetical protein